VTGAPRAGHLSSGQDSAKPSGVACITSSHAEHTDLVRLLLAIAAAWVALACAVAMAWALLSVVATHRRAAARHRSGLLAPPPLLPSPRPAREHLVS